MAKRVYQIRNKNYRLKGVTEFTTKHNGKKGLLNS